MKSHYQIIRRPVITEKGLAIKENQETLVFQVAKEATKTEIKEAVQTIFKVKVDSVRTANFPGKERRRGKFAVTGVRQPNGARNIESGFVPPDRACRKILRFRRARQHVHENTGS